MKNFALGVFLAGSVLASPALAQDKAAQPPADAQNNQRKPPPAGTAMPTSASGMGGSSVVSCARLRRWSWPDSSQYSAPSAPFSAAAPGCSTATSARREPESRS